MPGTRHFTDRYCPLGSPPARAGPGAGDVSDMALPAVTAAAKAHGIHPALVCIKWAVQTGHLVIPFAVKASQYQDNLRCVLSDPLDRGGNSPDPGFGVRLPPGKRAGLPLGRRQD